MTSFEFVFALVGLLLLLLLLLGLCLAEVFGGLGRLFEARRRRRIGWPLPLLGCYVLLDLMGYWSLLWAERGDLPVNPLVLLGGAAFTGMYYLAVYVVFPREIDQETDLDAHLAFVKTLTMRWRLLQANGRGRRLQAVAA